MMREMWLFTDNSVGDDKSNILRQPIYTPLPTLSTNSSGE